MSRFYTLTVIVVVVGVGGVDADVVVVVFSSLHQQRSKSLRQAQLKRCIMNTAIVPLHVKHESALKRFSEWRNHGNATTNISIE